MTDQECLKHILKWIEENGASWSDNLWESLKPISNLIGKQLSVKPKNKDDGC